MLKPGAEQVRWIVGDAAALSPLEADLAVEKWVELTNVDLPFVTFRATFVFRADGQVLTSDSTLRFWECPVVEAQLSALGYIVDEVRDAPDRPGREFVFIARRPG